MDDSPATVSARESWFSRLKAESGFEAILTSSRDVKILCMQRFIRMFAYGMTFLILVQFLSSLGVSDAKAGLFMTLTLLGDVVISFILTLITDQIGRRKVLVMGAALMFTSGVVFSMSSNYWILVLASIIGVISPSGYEVGPFRAVEESILAHLTHASIRSDIFAWYTLFGALGTAIGTLTCGWTVQALQSKYHWGETAAYQSIFRGYAVLGLLKLLLTISMSSAVESDFNYTYKAVEDREEDQSSLASEDDLDQSESQQPATNSPSTSESITSRLRSLLPSISPTSRSIMLRLIIVFVIDNFASGLAAVSWLTYFFATVHSLQVSTLGTLFLLVNILSTASIIFSIPLVRRFGNLKTMVFTHLPSALLIALIPLPPATTLGTWSAMILLCLRACSQTMDTAPRQAFVSAAVLPAERTAVLGFLNIVKTLAQSGGLGVAGVLAEKNLWIVTFIGAGVLKATYDFSLLFMFIGLEDRDDNETTRV